MMIIGSLLFFSFSIASDFFKREKSGTFPFVYLPVWILTCISTLYLVLAAFAMKDALSRHLYLLVFGIPADWTILLFLPWLVLVALTASLFKGNSCGGPKKYCHGYSGPWAV